MQMSNAKFAWALLWSENALFEEREKKQQHYAKT